MNEQETQLLAEYGRLENQLSPENLHCDGERSRAQARAIGQRLRNRQIVIVKRLGRHPTTEEIYGK